MFSRRGSKPFEARSPERDAAADVARAAAVGAAIDKALAEAETEKAGLARRLADVIARASVTVGNETDEYLTRDAHHDAHQSTLSADIKYAERRLQELEAQTANFRAMKEAAERN